MPYADVLRNLAQIVESGGLKPVLDEKRYSLEEVGQAHARLESGQAIDEFLHKIRDECLAVGYHIYSARLYPRRL